MDDKIIIQSGEGDSEELDSETTDDSETESHDENPVDSPVSPHSRATNAGNNESTTDEKDLSFTMEQLPEELTKSINYHMELFAENGVQIVGLGEINIEDDSEFEDPDETEGDVGLDIEDIITLDMYCEIEGTRFIYTFLPQDMYNAVEIHYDVVQDLFLASDVQALNELEDIQRVKAVNMLEEILPPGDLGHILRSNRTVDYQTLMSWIYMIRSQNPEYIQMFESTESGEITGVVIEKRVYIPNDPLEADKEIHTTLQELVNITFGYTGIFSLAYLNNGSHIPQSIAEQISEAVTEQNLESYDQETQADPVKGYW